MIDAAKRLAPATDFQVGDTEALAFGDGSFDGVASTCGAMFVAKSEAAAAEMARVRALLGGASELVFERGATVLRMPSGKAVWDIFVKGYGPTMTRAAALVAEKRAALERDFIAMHEKHRTPAGLAMPREYLVTIGVRR